MKLLRLCWEIINKNVRLLGAALALFCGGLVFVVSPSVLYADVNTWVDGALPTLALGQQVASASEPNSCFPTSMKYFSYTKPDGITFDSLGRTVTTPTCAAQNDLGLYGGSATGDDYFFVQPKTTLAFHIVSTSGSLIPVTPIPEQAGFFTKDATQSFNGEMTPHFYNDFVTAGKFGQTTILGTLSIKELAFQFQSGGTVLKDSAGKTIYMHAYAFSANGQWMVIEAVGLGIIRINTQTLAMQLFDQTKPLYGTGFRPFMSLAISNDGNSVIKSGSSVGPTAVYDLTNCQPASFKIGADNTSAIQGCRSRFVDSSLRSQLPGYLELDAMHFNADGKSVSAISVASGLNGVFLFNKVTYAIAGYQTPRTTYVALGDSFSSGEGAYNYELGTNEPDNICHLSKLSYPYVSASALGIDSFHSVACSGATTKEYSSPQIESGTNKMWPLGIWEPGINAQQLYLLQSGSSSVVTLSMVGNDIGFKDKLIQCMVPGDSCFHFQNDRASVAAEIHDAVNDKLLPLFKSIPADAGNPAVKVYVIGYPQIMGTGPMCSANVPFTQEERQMAQELISYLDATIKAATVKAGFQYIDDEYAFAGHMLCEGGSPAVNGLTVDGSAPGLLSKLNSSFHPNALGQQLMSQALLSQSENFTKTMSAANPTYRLPFDESSEYAAFVNSAPQGGTFKHLVYEPANTANSVMQGGTLDVAVNDLPLQPNASFQVWFHSTPALAGTLASDSQGRLVGSVPVPGDLAPGFHELDVLGQDVSGQNIDIYSEMYVAASEDDYNGDGVPNSQDPCLLVPSSGIDYDRDGIDDACDPEIAQPPADTVSPAVAGAADREPDHGGWYNHATTITWTATDPDPSSGTPTQPAPTLADQDGERTYTSDQSCDPAGNCAAGSIIIKLDKTAPGIVYTIDPSPNELGWNNAATTVHFSCSDAMSGIKSCSSPVTIAGDAAGYIVTGTAVDNAGNESSVNVIVAVDTSDPAVTTTISPAPNSSGWNNSDVTVTPTCSDSLSGVAACSQPTVISTEGMNQLVTSSAADNAGNSVATFDAVDIDKTAPMVQNLQWSANPKATTQTNTLSAYATDDLSGANQAEYFLGDTDPGIGKATPMQPSGDNFITTFGTDIPTGVYKVTVRAEDMAGNWSAAITDYLVVYNPFSVRMTGKRFVQPTLANGDVLPGLISSAQTDTAKFAFSVGYDAQGQPLPNNDLAFSYTTGSQCNRPAQAKNCHSLSLNALSIDWFITRGANNSSGIFQGSGVLIVDGISQQATFRLTAIDGEARSSTSSDHLQLLIFRQGDNPNTASPLYQANDDVLRGNIHIKV